MHINNKPKVSVGMPVYNGAKYIREALDSLLSQTYADFELIISDNASTDGTQQICEEYACKDSRIRYVRQLNNLGALNNFQFVLNEAVGEYFMWAAADDIWSFNWIESLLQLSSKNKNIFGFGQVLVIDENSILRYHVANNRVFNFSGNKFFRRMKYYFEPEFLGKANVIYGLFRVEDIKKILLIDYEFDYNINYDLLQFCEIKCNSEATIYKRIHDDNEENVDGINEKFNRNTFAKIVTNIFLMPMKEINMYLVGYIRHSNYLESIFLSLLYPLKVILVYYNLIKIKLTRY